MTRKEMEKLLEKLTKEVKNKKAANQPMYGDISFDRAIDEIFAQDEERGPNDTQGKGMALLYRHELNKTED